MEQLTTRPRIYEDAAEAIRQYIVQNRLRPGDPLPPERQIQQQLGISRASVREALRTLQMIGLVEARRGKGLFVKELDLQPMVRALSSNLELIDGISFGHLVDVRKALELELAEVAAVRRTPADVTILATSLDVMRQALARGDVATALAQDLSFHEILVQISRNPLFERLYSSIAVLLVEIRARSPQTTETQTASLREHDAIYRAIRDEDPAAAVEAMRQHMADLDRQLGDGLNRAFSCAEPGSPFRNGRARARSVHPLPLRSAAVVDRRRRIGVSGARRRRAAWHRRRLPGRRT